MPDVEADTNPIDRTVAHLLFHRPLEFSGKPSDAPNSPLSPSAAYEETENPSEMIFSEGDQSKNGLAFVTSENASNAENTDGVQVKAETSNWRNNCNAKLFILVIPSLIYSVSFSM